MKKVFVLPAGEDWIVDRFVSEWNEDNLDISTKDPREASIVWLMASWCWSQMPLQILSTKKVFDFQRNNHYFVFNYNLPSRIHF